MRLLLDEMENRGKLEKTLTEASSSEILLMLFLDFLLDTILFILVLQNSAGLDSSLLIYKKIIIAQLMLKNDLTVNAVIGASLEWK